MMNTIIEMLNSIPETVGYPMLVGTSIACGVALTLLGQTIIEAIKSRLEDDEQIAYTSDK